MASIHLMKNPLTVQFSGSNYRKVGIQNTKHLSKKACKLLATNSRRMINQVTAAKVRTAIIAVENL